MQKRTRDRSLSLSSHEDDVQDYQDEPFNPQSHKYQHLEAASPSATDLVCRLAPHEALAFSSYVDYEKHYQQSHTNRCADCMRNFPTEHFLSLHIVENHDSITAIRRDRGDRTFGCFVEGCDKVCATWQRRRAHLVDKHKYPREYDFFIVNDGVDGRTSMLRSDPYAGKPWQQASGKTEAALVSSTRGDEPASSTGECAKAPDSATGDVDMLTSSMSSLRFVPSKVRFGRHQAAFKSTKG